MEVSIISKSERNKTSNLSSIEAKDNYNLRAAMIHVVGKNLFKIGSFPNSFLQKKESHCIVGYVFFSLPSRGYHLIYWNSRCIVGDILLW